MQSSQQVASRNRGDRLSGGLRRELDTAWNVGFEQVAVPLAPGLTLRGTPAYCAFHGRHHRRASEVVGLNLKQTASQAVCEACVRQISRTTLRAARVRDGSQPWTTATGELMPAARAIACVNGPAAAAPCRRPIPRGSRCLLGGPNRPNRWHAPCARHPLPWMPPPEAAAACVLAPSASRSLWMAAQQARLPPRPPRGPPAPPPRNAVAQDLRAVQGVDW